MVQLTVQLAKSVVHAVHLEHSSRETENARERERVDIVLAGEVSS